MKRKLILALLILAVGTSFVFAGAFGAGVSVGGNLAFVGTDPSGDGTPRYGFTGGIYGDYAFYSMENVMDLSAQLGVYYSQKGYRSELTSPVTTDLTVNIDYIEVPVLVKASIPLDIPVDPYLLVGGSVGMIVVKSAETDPAVAPVNDSVESDTKDLDYGLVFGAGVDLDMGVSIDARFNLGLANITESASYDYMKNRSVSLMVSYNIL
jgi:hypothetical protein